MGCGPVTKFSSPTKLHTKLMDQARSPKEKLVSLGGKGLNPQFYMVVASISGSNVP